MEVYTPEQLAAIERDAEEFYERKNEDERIAGYIRNDEAYYEDQRLEAELELWRERKEAKNAKLV
jgi:hypothetical protein